MPIIACPRCGATVPAGDVDLSTKLGRCRGCDEVFELAPQLARTEPIEAQTRGEAVVARRERAMPDAVRILEGARVLRGPSDHEPGALAYRGSTELAPVAPLTLAWRWYRPAVLLQAAFSVFWCGFLAVWYALALSAPSPWGIALWFPLGHVGVGVFLAYTSAAGILNRTTLRMDGEAIEVRHDPVPMGRPIRLETRAIEGVFVRRKDRSLSRMPSAWEVCVDLATGCVPLLTRLPSEEEARFFARAIAEQLGVPLTSTSA